MTVRSPGQREPGVEVSRRVAALAVVAGAATWGTTGTSQALAEVAVSPVMVGAARTVFGALALVVLAAITRRGGTSRTPRTSPSASGAGVTGPLLVAGAAIAAYQVLFFGGVAATGVAVGTVVGIGSVPVLTGALAWAADGDRPTARWWAATGAAVVGAAMVLGSSSTTSQVDAVGVLLSLGAGLSYAVLTVASRRLLDAGLPPTSAMARVFLVGAVPSAVVLLLGDAAGLASTRGVLLVGWLAVVTVALGYALYARGLQVLPPATVGTLTLTEPLVAAVLGIALLAERPGAVAAAGMAALVLGLLLVVERPAATIESA